MARVEGLTSLTAVGEWRKVGLRLAGVEAARPLRAGGSPHGWPGQVPPLGMGELKSCSAALRRGLARTGLASQRQAVVVLQPQPGLANPRHTAGLYMEVKPKDCAGDALEAGPLPTTHAVATTCCRHAAARPRKTIGYWVISLVCSSSLRAGPCHCWCWQAVVLR